MTTISRKERDQGIQRVLLITLMLNLLVSSGKIVIGAVTGALSITADGFHSLMDGASNGFGLIANRIAAQPADADHPYGHRRFETLAALAVGILLLITAWEIISSAVERLANPQPPTMNPLAFGVLIGTLAVNLFVSTYERREGKRLRSELLVADAANTSADVFVTLSVLASMVLVALGWTWADPIAALLIVGLIGRAAWSVIRQTGRVLVDAAPIEPNKLVEIAREVPAVEQVIRARSRGTADAAHIDIDVSVPPEMTAAHTAAIAQAIREKMEGALEGVQEVEVHFAPQTDASMPDYVLVARARADALGISTHEVRVSDTPKGKLLEMHVEVPPGETLKHAHDRVSELEREVRAHLPEVFDVVTHIEPALLSSHNHETDTTLDDAVTARAYHLLRTHYPQYDWHHFHLTPYEGGAAISLHVGLSGDVTVEAAHRLAEEAEMLVRTSIPDVERVTIHTEPKVE